MTQLGVATHCARLLGLFLSLLLVSAAAAQSQIAIRIPTSTPEVETILAQGRELETQRRWGEAVSLYEEASRRNPGLTALEDRLDLAKIHYDLGRRYADSSFRKSVTTLSEQESLDLFAQVMSRIFTHYVHQPDWKALVHRGTLGLSVALYEPTFVEEHLTNIDADRIAGFRTECQQLTAGMAIHDRNQARDAVTHVARLAQQRIGLNPTVVVFEYIAGALGGLDEYSAFLTSGQLTDIYSQIDGNFVGLGVELKAQNNALLIVNVIPGSPADRAGIKKNDRLVGVAGRSTHEMTTDQAADLLQGEAGTTVDLVAVTGDESPRTLQVRREQVEVPSIEGARLLDAEAGIAYLKLSCFQKTTSSDLDGALWKLYRQGMKSLIIDLRGNPGGLLTSSVEIADKFLEQGSIVATRGRGANEDFNYTAHRVGTWRVPLVVLIDGESASASEILAGALRDHRRATIVGARSYGKGSVQGIFPLTIGGMGVRLTTAKFYSPNGHPYSRVGVEPDVLVRAAEKPILGMLGGANNAAAEVQPPTTAQVTPENDATLQAGLQAARRQVARVK